MKRLTEKDLATRWDMSPRTLQGWRKKGIGPAFIQIGERSIFYRLEDVDAYEEANIVGKLPSEPDGWRQAMTRAASAFDTLAKKAGPKASITLGSLRDELRALLA